MDSVTTGRLTHFTAARLPALVAFLNEVLANRRHWAPINEADFAERVLVQPGFDPRGLILARCGERIVGGVHAIKPSVSLPTFRNSEPRHHITWLAVHPEFRTQRVGNRLLAA